MKHMTSVVVLQRARGGWKEVSRPAGVGEGKFLVLGIACGDGGGGRRRRSFRFDSKSRGSLGKIFDGWM